MEAKVFRQSDSEYYLSLLLRYRVLRIPLGLTFTAEDLAKDKYDTHIGLFEADRIYATLILTNSGGGSIKMRQVAVDEDMQGRGLGRHLVLFAENHAKKEGYKLIHCNARDLAKPFYEKLGYKVSGNSFIEIGIVHYLMEKNL